MQKNYLILLFLIFYLSNACLAQDTIRNKKKNYKSKIADVSKALQNSLNDNNELNIARNYEKLAEEFASKNDNSKAEEYLKKALNSYSKLNLDDDKTRVTRRKSLKTSSTMRLKTTKLPKKYLKINPKKKSI
jgi:two-component system, sensor histidine kinase YesM